MNKAYPEVGDVVHYWREDPPPLSYDYVAPACQHALVVSLHDDPPEQTATLAIVTDAGLLVRVDVPRQESYATTGLRDWRQSDRSYGVPSSWHSWDH